MSSEFNTVPGPSGGLEEMLTLIAEEHLGKVDKAGKPYVLHLITVMNKIESGELAHQLMGLGHDLIEDGKSGPAAVEAKLRARFSSRVVEGIKNVTKVPGERREDYESKVMSSVDSMLVKKADLEHNMDLSRLPEVTEKDIQRHTGYIDFHARIKARLEAAGHVFTPKESFTISMHGSPDEIGTAMFEKFAGPAFATAHGFMPPEVVGLIYAGMFTAMVESMKSNYGPQVAERMLQDIVDLQREMFEKPTCH